jgi:hypothetical protein
VAIVGNGNADAIFASITYAAGIAGLSDGLCGEGAAGRAAGSAIAAAVRMLATTTFPTRPSRGTCGIPATTTTAAAARARADIRNGPRTARAGVA